MAYRVKRTDSNAAASLRRIAREQVGAALRCIDTAQSDRASAVHEVRKRCKKIRGLLRLVRPAFGEYRQENAAFRDIASALGPMRDAAVLVDAFDRVFAGTGAEGPDLLAPVRQRLCACREERLAEQDPDTLLRSAHEALSSALERIGTWHLSRKGFGAFATGLESTYRRGRKAMRAACRSGHEQAFHAWRKRCKDHGFHLRLLQPIWPDPMRAQHGCAAGLGECLGQHHDLAVLRARVSAMADIEAATTELCVERIEARQRELAQRACSLGARLYALPPAALATGWRRRHAAWRDEARSS